MSMKDNLQPHDNYGHPEIDQLPEAEQKYLRELEQSGELYGLSDKALEEKIMNTAPTSPTAEDATRFRNVVQSLRARAADKR